MSLINSIEAFVDNWIKRQIVWAGILVLLDISFAWGLLAAIGFIAYSIVLALPLIARIISFVFDLFD